MRIDKTLLGVALAAIALVGSASMSARAAATARPTPNDINPGGGAGSCPTAFNDCNSDNVCNTINHTRIWYAEAYTCTWGIGGGNCNNNKSVICSKKWDVDVNCQPYTAPDGATVTTICGCRTTQWPDPAGNGACVGG